MKTVGFILMTLFFLLASVPWMRVYFRTGLKGALLNGVGTIFVAIGVPGFFYWFDSAPMAFPFLPLLCLVLVIAGGLCLIVSLPVLYIKESGLWKEIYDKTTYWQRVTGNVPIVKYEKPPAPSANRQAYIILGILMMTGGILAFIFIKLTMNYFLTAAISSFIIGLLFVIYSIVYLNKNKEHHR
jgi:hypothetical protein